MHPERFIAASAAHVTAFLCLGFLAVMAGAGGFALGAYLLASYDLPPLQKVLSYRPAVISTFYANDGETIGRFFTEERRVVPLKTLPPHVVSAIISAEDRRFFHHPGVDGYAVIRAALKNIEAGHYTQGGSTITQQLVRLLLLTNERKMMRKLREALLAVRLEREIGKQQILEIYLNQVYFGRGTYGIEKAAESYFGKPARDLTIREAALLAGLLANPSTYSQPENESQLRRRTDMVLKRMMEDGHISEGEYRRALRTAVSVRDDRSKPFVKAPYFTLAVKRYIVKKYGLKKLFTDGLKVYTTVDLALQQAAARSLLKGAMEWEERQKRGSGLVDRWKPDEWAAFKKKHLDDLHAPGDLVFGCVVKPYKEQANRSNVPTYDVELVDGSRYRLALPGPIPYSVGDVLRFRIVRKTAWGTEIKLYRVPAVQGALVCIENETGYVRALVGGLDYAASRYNRAIGRRGVSREARSSRSSTPQHWKRLIMDLRPRYLTSPSWSG